MKQFYLLIVTIRNILIGAFLAANSGITFAQQSYTFTNCSATGSLGPTQLQVTNSYSPTNLNGMVTVQNGIQSWTVPITGNYKISAYGAQGGNASTYNGGLGAMMSGDFSLTAGSIVKILVGQIGGNGGINGGTYMGAGGGGGSYVTVNNTLYVAAGGGGGAGIGEQGANGFNGNPGLTTINGNIANGVNNNANGAPGTNGNGGQGSTYYGAAGGAGWLTNGTNSSGSSISTGGLTFNNGGTGGTGGLYQNTYGGWGGFGGGGGGTFGGGGGGGYSGGGSGVHGANYNATAGGGGGSYNAGTNQNNTAGINSGHGRVIITELCNISLNASSNPICAGTTVTLTTNAVSNYSWSTGSTASSIIVTPNANTSYSLTATSVSNCIAGAAVNITVSSGVPVLAVTSSTDQVCLGKSVTLTASGALTYTWTGGVTNGVGFFPQTTSGYTVSGQNGCGTSNAVTNITVAPLPVTVAASSPTVCSAKSATLMATAAATSYTWQPVTLFQGTIIVSPTVSTVYTVSASDGTCSGVASISLTVLPVPTIGVVASTSQVCTGMPVNLSASGGLSYTWMPGNLSGASVAVTPTAATLYTVTGINSVGCTTSTTQIVLTESSPPVNVAASSTFVCPGDNVTLIASGNVGGFQWTNGPSTSSFAVSPSVTTAYTVTGTSTTNTCTTVKTIQVNVFLHSVTLSSSSPTVCSGNTVTLTASGADSYHWDNNTNQPVNTVTPNVNTTYTLSATSTSVNLSCNSTHTIQINVMQNPTVTATSNRTLICKDESTVLHASGAGSYSWSNGSNTSSASVAPPGITIHIYTVTGNDEHGCKGQATIQVRTTACAGITRHITSETNFLVYPNPSNGEISIQSETGQKLRLLNTLGQCVTEIILDEANGFKANILNLAGGVYILTNSRSVAIKVIVD